MTLAQHSNQQLRPAEWWKAPAETAALSDHLIDKLCAAGLKTVGDVMRAGPSKLREIEGIGAGAVEEIKTWLRMLDEGKPATAPQAAPQVSQPRAANGG